MTAHAPLQVRVSWVRQEDASLPLPTYQTPGSAGVDLRAAVAESVTLEPGQRMLVPTGLSFEIPEGWEGQVRPRSGIAFRHGVTVLNAPGTIDADYRGEVQVLLIHHGDTPFVIDRGERIAQMVFAPCTQAVLTLASDLTSTARGAGGFGHTGTE